MIYNSEEKFENVLYLVSYYSLQHHSFRMLMQWFQTIEYLNKEI